MSGGNLPDCLVPRKIQSPDDIVAGADEDVPAALVHAAEPHVGERGTSPRVHHHAVLDSFKGLQCNVKN